MNEIMNLKLPKVDIRDKFDVKMYTCKMHIILVLHINRNTQTALLIQ